MKNIAVIGYGALGKILVDATFTHLSKDYYLKGIYDIALKDDSITIQGKEIPLYPSIDAILEDEVDIVVEIAGVGAVKNYGPRILASKKDLVITSVGALADHDLYDKLIQTAKEEHQKIHITSGAIGGFDIMRTIYIMGKASSTIQSTKAPKSLNGAPYLKGKTLPEDKTTVAFEGSATDAIAGFPKNTNVCVATGLVTCGPEKTTVRLISDPKKNGNTHCLTVENPRAKALIEITSKTDPKNPKSSVTAAFSVVALLENLASPIQFF